MFPGQKVVTPYGIAIYVGVNPKNIDIIKVQPTDWMMGHGRNPIFYFNKDIVKPLFSVGDNVYSEFGEGSIVGFRERDKMFEVELLHWVLGEGKNPTLYLQESALSDKPVARVKGVEKHDDHPTELLSPLGNYKPSLHEEPSNYHPNNLPNHPNNSNQTNHLSDKCDQNARTSQVDCCIADSIMLKAKAGTLYKLGDFQQARNTYQKALQTMECEQENHGLTDMQNAVIFEHTVPCLNNISLCCMQMRSYKESVVYAEKAIQLIEAMEGQISIGPIWQCLAERGMTQKKLLKEWKKKSYFLAGKAELLNRKYGVSMSYLKSALDLMEGDEAAAVEISKLKDLYTTAIKKQAVELNKEKKTWQVAFEKNKIESDNIPEGPSSPLTGIDFAERGLNTKIRTLSDVSDSDKKRKRPGNNNENENENEKVIAVGGDDDDSRYDWIVGVSAVVAAFGIFTFLMTRVKPNVN